jgi:hypothetical protein
MCQINELLIKKLLQIYHKIILQMIIKVININL